MSVAIVFAQAEEQIESGDFESALQLLREVVLRPNLTPIEYADAFYLLGTIVRICPKLGSDGDECGVSYYKVALNHMPTHRMALWGIVSTYGERFPDHQDSLAAQGAIAKLIDQIDELPEPMKASIEEKRKLLERVISG